ncbi:TlpA family protein disulfide reductase [Ferroacidibacillus organovorans]|uniref:Thioredoxin domain-containing protein n=1 Tax=Ferroacidibacillus organovorans TaxID=1765683 RepID=A0A853KB94_9BACL|nr:thioredoxin family protein [Ferroacidibacillus organovorans]KYP79793.1 hypothetical protein AYJ22_13710 [Ferroacidibacillus organovorans]OAG93634.1 hypothetical protein AYW79_09775 [Ferroacidibacillus organovorans]
MNKWVLSLGLVVIVGIGISAVNAVGRQAQVSNVNAPPTTSQTHSTATGNVGYQSLSFHTVSGQVLHVNPNKKTVLHFMTSTCASCVPTERMLTKFSSMPGVQIISVDINPQNDNLRTIQQFERTAHSNWPYVMETTPYFIDTFHVTELDTVVVLEHGHVIFNKVLPSFAQLKKVLA